jgi:Zn-dependent peptidase ImmA (M78 family)
MPIIAINNKDWERAKVFSLFHEVAHLLRRSSSLCLIDFNERSDNEEKICDKIAAETLLPEKTFKSLSSTIKKEFGDWNDNCLLKIADLYAVSTAVVLRRLYELGTISKSYYITRYSQLADEFEKNKNYNKENIIVKYHYRFLNKQGYLFPRTILTAYANGIITYGEMCRSLNVNSMHIGNIEQAVMYR